MSEVRLDKLDRAILAILQRDGRITNLELAKRIHLSPSACLRRLQALEVTGIIAGYVAVLSEKAIGRPTSVFVEVTLTSQCEEVLDAFERAVQQCAEIMECYLMAGEADYLIRVIAADTQDYERIHKQYLTRLPGVSRLRSSFALRTVSKKVTLDL